MTASDWMTQFLVGGVCGVMGQCLRVVVGLKKVNDAAARDGRAFRELFSWGDLVVSLLVGAVAGVIGMLSADLDLQAIRRDDILLLFGAGYAGADFIEGFVRKRLPPAPAATAAVVAPGPAPGLDTNPAVG